MVRILFYVFLLISTAADAQLAAKNQIYVMDDFSGGLNTKASPFTLPKNEGAIYENLRLDPVLKAISKRDEIFNYGSADATEPILGMHRLYLSSGTKVLLVNHGDEIEKGNDSTGVFTNILNVSSGDRRWQWLTWHNIAIGTDGYNQPVKYDGSSSSATYLGTALAADAGSGAGPNGTYTYKVTCYTASYEASMNVASNSVTVSDNDITLTMIPVCPDAFLGETVTGRKIYRIENAGSTYKILTNGTIADNSTVTLVDSDADAALGAALSPTHTRTPPKGKLSVVHFNRLWIANNPDNPSTIYYSADGTPDFFDTGNTVNGGEFPIRKDDGDEITFVKNLLGNLTIGKNNSIQKLYTDGDTPSTEWSVSDPFSPIGCHAPYSVVSTPIGIIYLSNNGLYSFNGQISALLSDKITPEIQDISFSNFQNVWGEYAKNTYFLSYASTSSGSSTNNRVLVFDFITKSYSKDLISVNVFHTFRSGSDVELLYAGSSTNGKVYVYGEANREIIHKAHSDFTGTFDDMRYIPTDAGGDADDPVLELAWVETIDAMTATIDATVGIIDRPDTDGSYISQALTLNASTLDKLYWNEDIPAGATTGDVLFSFRTGATTPDVLAAAWTGGFTLPSGSDISGVSGNVYGQYRIDMNTGDITYTPTITKENNYNVRITFSTAGSVADTTIPIHYQSGWMDFGYPGYKKTLRKIRVLHEGEDGTLAVKIQNYDGDETTFSINLTEYPDQYVEYFENGAFLGEFFKVDITESSLNPLDVKRIEFMYDIEPII